MVLAAVVLTGACAERQDGGEVCPVLCPEQSIPTRDTVIEAIGVSATVSSFPGLGSEPTLLLAKRGDSLDTRAVIRFDSIPSRYRTSVSNTDTTTALIAFVDSAELRLRIDTSGTKATTPVTVSLYDVDTTAADSSTAALVALFRADRLIGAATFDTAALKDTLRVKIDTAFLRQRIVDRQRVRIGVQVTSSESVQLRVFSSLGEAGPQLVFDPSADTATRVGSYRPVSLTPEDNKALARDLADFTLIVTGSDDPVSTPNVLRVGGLPSSRGYLRFELPESIVDSGTVVRATLTLTQIPSLRFDSAQRVTLYAQPSIASAIISAPDKAALLIGAVTDSAQVLPNGAGVIEFELVRLFRRWKGTKAVDQPRVLILRASTEGISPVELRIHDVNAASGLRPRLRITYVPRVDFGLP